MTRTFGSVVALCGLVSNPPAAAAARPNILLCLADDWSYPHAGCYGDRVVRSPTFDRVAADGTLFTHAFCVAPTCTASRAAIPVFRASRFLQAAPAA